MTLNKSSPISHPSSVLWKANLLHHRLARRRGNTSSQTLQHRLIALNGDVMQNGAGCDNGLNAV